MIEWISFDDLEDLESDVPFNTWLLMYDVVSEEIAIGYFVRDQDRGFRYVYGSPETITEDWVPTHFMVVDRFPNIDEVEFDG